MLILSNDDVEALLSMEICLDALERAYRAWAEGKAISRPRSDLYLPFPESSDFYVFKSMDGGLMEPRVASLRLNSDVIRWQEGAKGQVKNKIPAAPGGTWVGLVLLFSADTGEPLAIMPDGVMQRLRVAATSGLAARRLARRDAAVLGIIGAGWQAGAHAAAMTAIAPIRTINVYSPTAANREALARDLAQRLPVAAAARDTAEAVAADADILVAATNTTSRVVPPDWVRPGMFLTCVKGTELGDDTVARADRVVIHYRRQPENYVAGLGDDRIEGHDPIKDPHAVRAAAARPEPPWMNAPELKDLIAGRARGRESPDEVTCFVNNIGVGLQFTALGAAALAGARARGLGRQIPTEWFLEHVHP